MSHPFSSSNQYYQGNIATHSASNILIEMIGNFQAINRSISEDSLEEISQIFRRFSNTSHQASIDKLFFMLHEMQISIPDSMLKDMNYSATIMPTYTFDFKSFTHYVARASLEMEDEQEMSNLFDHIDKLKCGYVDAQDIVGFLKRLEYGHKMSHEDVNAFVNERDTLKLGYLTYEHFVYLLLPK